MGTSQSKCIVSDPDSFAHRISPERDGGPQSRYDYIIVGGGELGVHVCDLCSELTEIQERPDAFLRLASPRTQILPSYSSRQAEGMQIRGADTYFIQH